MKNTLIITAVGLLIMGLVCLFTYKAHFKCTKGDSITWIPLMKLDKHDKTVTCNDTLWVDKDGIVMINREMLILKNVGEKFKLDIGTQTVYVTVDSAMIPKKVNGGFI